MAKNCACGHSGFSHVTERGACSKCSCKGMVKPLPRKTSSCKTLVPVDRSVCPACGGEMEPIRASEVALFRHGGYGATRETNTVLCRACGWGLTTDVTEVRP